VVISTSSTGSSRLRGWGLAALCLAVAAQYFLAKPDQSWTLGPGLVFLLFAVAVSAPLASLSSPGVDDPSADPVFQHEKIILTGILLLAAWVRLVALDRFPPGIQVECASIGIGAYRILEEGWRPLFETPFMDHPGMVFYPAAAWFGFIPPSKASLGAFFALFSLAAFPFIYWTFRQLAGPRIALIALFLLAVMRWHIAYSRWGHAMVQPPLYLFACLAFGLYGWRKAKQGYMVAAAVVLGIGLYTYQSAKVFPLLVAAILCWEARRDPVVFRQRRGMVLRSALLFVVLVSPLLVHWMTQESLGKRESEIFIGGQILREKSLSPLIRKAGGVLALFNRRGDESLVVNDGKTRMLDDVTGTLLLAGLGILGFGWRARRNAWMLLAAPILLSTDFLAWDSPHSSRLLPLAPWVALAAAQALERFAAAAGCSFRFPRAAAWITVAALAGAAWMNLDAYFRVQVRSPVMAAANDFEASCLAQRIREEGDGVRFLVPPRFADHRTIAFLNHDHEERWSAWQFPRDFGWPSVGDRKEICFVFQSAQGGLEEWFRELYPGGILESVPIPDGSGSVRFYRLSAEVLRRAASPRALFLKGEARPWMDFPETHPEVKGATGIEASLYMEKPGTFRLGWDGASEVRGSLGGTAVVRGGRIFLDRGFYEFRVHWKSGNAPPRFWLEPLGGGTRLMLDSKRLTRPGLGRGLRAEFRRPGPAGRETVVWSGWFPMVNVTFRTEWPDVVQPYHGVLKGELEISREGVYGMEALIYDRDRAVLKVDGKTVVWTSGVDGGLYLSRGRHRVDIHFEKTSSFLTALSLIWKKPGANRWEVVPPRVWGLARPEALSGTSRDPF
jgi:hypothetical protein